MSKSTVKIVTIWLLILCCLLGSSCGSLPINEGSEDRTHTKEDTSSDDSETVDLTSNFTIEVDVSSIDYPTSVPVIYAEKLTWEFDELRSAFKIDAIKGLNITDDCVREGAGDILRGDNGEYSLSLVNFLDGKYGDKNRNPTGYFGFCYSPLSGSDIIISYLLSYTSYEDTFANSQISPYSSENNLSELTYLETVEKFNGLFFDLGLEGEDIPEVDISYFFSSADQIYFFENGPEPYLPYIVDPQTGNRELPDEIRNGLSDAIVLGWRQNFFGVPVNSAAWGGRFSVGTLGYTAVELQRISSYLMADGSYALYANSLFIPVSYGEAKAVCSPQVPIDHLSSMLGFVLDEIEYYLVKVELTYAIFEDGEDYVLYPYWILFVENKQEYSGEIIRSASYANIYAYDGYTGEMVVSIDNPLK